MGVAVCILLLGPVIASRRIVAAATLSLFVNHVLLPPYVILVSYVDDLVAEVVLV